MEQDWQPQEWTESAWPKAGKLFLLLISPVGAPIVGWTLIHGCDIRWEGDYRCVVPAPLIDYFMACTFAPWAFGLVPAILWHMASLVVLLGFLFYAAKAVRQTVAERRRDRSPP
jgi:hypothetical protein